MKKPKVSIITTAYNHEAFIGRCMQSVLDQTHTSWEQIVIDDASTDKTYEIAKLYATGDKRIKVFRHKKNFGIKRLSDSYNQALKIAKGKYIAILESDDYWPKDKLEKQTKTFRNNKVALSFGNCVLVNASGYPIRLFTYQNNHTLQKNRPLGAVLRLFYKLNFSIIPVTVMIRRNALQKIGGFRKDKHYPFVDIPTFLRLALEGEYCYVDEILGYYRKQPQSYWFDFASRTQAMGRNEVKECVKSFIKTYGTKTNHFKLNIGDLGQEQVKYIQLKKIIKPISLIFNRISFRSGPTPMVVVYVLELLTYKLKKTVTKTKNWATLPKLRLFSRKNTICV